MRTLPAVSAALAAACLAACVPTDRHPDRPALSATRVSDGAPAAVRDPGRPGRYASLRSEPFPVAAIDTARIAPGYLRAEVAYPTPEPPGTVVVDTANRHLYLVQEGGRAIRYGVGVGKEGMSWSGAATIGAKREWPDWYPPREMIARRPDIENQIRQLPSGRGLPGGEGNPLGARAMYLHQGGKDTLFRIHGTLEPYTMGQAVSSGCIRMINQDAIDLFSRVEVGTRVVVLPDAPRAAIAALAPPLDAHAGAAVFPVGRPGGGYASVPVPPASVPHHSDDDVRDEVTDADPYGARTGLGDRAEDDYGYAPYAERGDRAGGYGQGY